MARRPFSKPICAKEERMACPRAFYRSSHAVCTLWVLPPTFPCQPFLLAQNPTPKEIARSDITS